jgi:uncharacterized protein (TIGR00369 family)
MAADNGESVYVPGVARYFKTTMWVGSDDRCRATLPVRPDLLDADGGLRLGAVTYAVDVATGICSGIAVIERGLWIVTTDIQVEMVGSVVEGPLAVDAATVRAGATTVVCEFTLTDLADGRVVGGGTTTNRPFPFEGRFDALRFPRDTPIRHDDGSAVSDEPMATQLDIRPAGEDGSVEVDVTDRTRNPWGILHGGITGALVDLAATAVGNGRTPTTATLRYLSPGRVGPVRATPRVLSEGADATLVAIDVRDTGQDDRLVATATVSLR